MTDKPIIQMVNIVKTFPGVKALDNMSLDLIPGEIHCLVGENGAGKSTLMKVLSGAYTPDSGEIIFEGTHYKKMNTALSKDLGIDIIYQENLLVPWMNIPENIFVGREITKNGIVDFKAQEEKAMELCEYTGMKLDLKKPVAQLSVAEQQFVKIIKSLATKPKVLVMDEPTSMFNTYDAEKVTEMVKKIVASGVGVFYISHFLKEVKAIADRITVIRDGAPIRTYDNHNKDVDLDKIVSDMVGRDASMFYQKEEHEIGEKIFEVKDIQVEPDGPKISFDIRKGEVLGMAGMVGSGRTELANAIFGAARKYGGQIFYNGKELKINSPIDSINNGLAYITEDRQRRGLILHAPIIENMASVGIQQKQTVPGFTFNIKEVFPALSKIISGLNIKMASVFQSVGNLSGGNQQKVVLGKWLFTDSKIFIFDEPTRGIDVNAKAEFYQIITELAAKGACVLMISSDMMEIISMSDRCAVMRDGQIVKILEKDEISENSIIRNALEVENNETA